MEEQYSELDVLTAICTSTGCGREFRSEEYHGSNNLCPYCHNSLKMKYTEVKEHQLTLEEKEKSEILLGKFFMILDEMEVEKMALPTPAVQNGGQDDPEEEIEQKDRSKTRSEEEALNLFFESLPYDRRYIKCDKKFIVPNKRRIKNKAKFVYTLSKVSKEVARSVIACEMNRKERERHSRSIIKRQANTFKEAEALRALPKAEYAQRFIAINKEKIFR